MLATAFLVASPVMGSESVSVGNEQITRRVGWSDGQVLTQSIANLRGDSEIRVSAGDEFAITIRLPGSDDDLRLTSADFAVRDFEPAADRASLDVRLAGKTAPVDLVVRYFAKPGEAWMRKRLVITAKQPLQVRKVDVERLSVADAYSPYKADQFTSQGAAKWRPPLGQPLYTKDSGTWWGVEFPAARNEVREGQLNCGYLTAVDLNAGETYATHTAVVGGSDNPEFVKEAFFEYIDATRARPLRLQTQYNTWFDYNRNVDAAKFAASVRKVHEELVNDRDVPPLRIYAIDAGWQDVSKDWTKVGVWPVNEKFAPDFGPSRQEAEKAGGALGLWVSPGCLFGSERAIPPMKAAGWRTLAPWMSMTGENYMDALDSRLVELAKGGVSYFKLDGIFGHLRTRNFDVEGFQGAEPALNDPAYDEAKERYISLGSERLMQIFQHMAEVNPEVYIVISNGAFLSPWWLQHIDAVWLINVGDHARGEGRSPQLAYRDNAYYQFASTERDNAQFPLHSIFNHEPKKITNDESPDEFRRYLLMSLSRGTGFVELYLHTFSLSESDWDILAEGLQWTHRMFPTFKRSRMIGGDPLQGSVSGYAGWTKDIGYLSLHNPADETREFTITLNRQLGIPPEAVDQGASYLVSSPLEEDVEMLPKRVDAGQKLAVKLPPHAIRILEFSRSAPKR